MPENNLNEQLANFRNNYPQFPTDQTTIKAFTKYVSQQKQRGNYQSNSLNIKDFTDFLIGEYSGDSEGLNKAIAALQMLENNGGAQNALAELVKVLDSTGVIENPELLNQISEDSLEEPKKEQTYAGQTTEEAPSQADSNPSGLKTETNENEDEKSTTKSQSEQEMISSEREKLNTPLLSGIDGARVTIKSSTSMPPIPTNNLPGAIRMPRRGKQMAKMNPLVSNGQARTRQATPQRQPQLEADDNRNPQRLERNRAVNATKPKKKGSLPGKVIKVALGGTALGSGWVIGVPPASAAVIAFVQPETVEVISRIISLLT